MKVILLENIMHKGTRYKAGYSLELDAETAEKFERSGIAIMDAPEPAGIVPEPPRAEQKTVKTGKKPSASKKAARGQK